jgi:hypothetical protein
MHLYLLLHVSAPLIRGPTIKTKEALCATLPVAFPVETWTIDVFRLSTLGTAKSTFRNCVGIGLRPLQRLPVSKSLFYNCYSITLSLACRCSYAMAPRSTLAGSGGSFLVASSLHIATRWQAWVKRRKKKTKGKKKEGKKIEKINYLFF